MDHADNQKVLRRLNRISGQVAGVRKMVEEGRYCVEILHQIAALRSALNALGIELLTKHLEGCVLGHSSAHECAQPLSQEELLAEVRQVVAEFLK